MTLNAIWMGVLLSCYLSFIWSVIGVFKVRTKKVNYEYRILQVVSIVIWVRSLFVLAQSEIEPLVSLLGIITGILSLVLFWWARRTISGREMPLIFSNLKPAVLIQDGPYMYVRHPFYCSYLFCYLTVSVLMLDYILLLGFIASFTLYYRATLAEESVLISSTVFEGYSEYQKKVGRFFPHLFKRKVKQASSSSL